MNLDPAGHQKAPKKKPVLRMTAGLLAVLIGAMGVGLSVFVLVQIHTAVAVLKQELPLSLGHVEQVTQSVRHQGEAAAKVLQTTRERVVYLGESIEDLSGKLDTRDPNASLLLIVDEDIDIQLDNAKQFVLSMQNSMRNLGSTLLVFDSMSLFANGSFSATGGRTAGQPENPIRSVAAGLTQTADLLDQVILGITKLQSGESINSDQLAAIHRTLLRVDLELVKIKSEVKAFSDEVAETESKVTILKQDSPAWVQYLSNIVTIFFVCFGFSQLMLALHGWHLVKSARTDWVSSPPVVP